MKVAVRLISALKVFEVHDKISREELQKSVDVEIGEKIVIVIGLQKWNKYKWEYVKFNLNKCQLKSYKNSQYSQRCLIRIALETCKVITD
jgi:hypothetical protein